jgi:hypothetical protein
MIASDVELNASAWTACKENQRDVKDRSYLYALFWSVQCTQSKPVPPSLVHRYTPSPILLLPGGSQREEMSSIFANQLRPRNMSLNAGGRGELRGLSQ